MTEAEALLLADAILVAHFAIAIFITYSLPIIWVGRFLHWKFVHNPWFRYTHLGLILFVVIESLAGKLCPLTIWEDTLRRMGGEAGVGEGQSFVGHWVGRLLFHDFNEWVFTLAYVLFFAAVAATFIFIPVKRRKKPPAQPPRNIARR